MCIRDRECTRCKKYTVNRTESPSYFYEMCIRDSYIARADVERAMKPEDLALVDLEEALRLNPSSADAYLLRGNIYLTQKKNCLLYTSRCV